MSKKNEQALYKYLNNSEDDFQNMSQTITAFYKCSCQEAATRLQKFIDADAVSEALESLSDNFRGLQYDFGKVEDDIFYADPLFSYLTEHASKYNKDYQKFARDVETAKERLENLKNGPRQTLALQSWQGFSKVQNRVTGGFPVFP